MRYLLFSTFFIGILWAQSPATRKDNMYWKNRPPYPGYWQQDVSHLIRAEVLPDSNQVTGNLALEYKNNSPDTLRCMYFHLYQNAFQPGSYRDQLTAANYYTPHYGSNEAMKRGTEVSNLTVGGRAAKFTVDNTILKVELPSVILPGASVQVKMDFTTWFDTGSEDRRMKMIRTMVKGADGNLYEVKHFDGVHWYPRVAVYDHKFAWETAQHLGKEFYGEFGNYEVELTLPMEYVMDATGVLQNPDEVMPAELRRRLDIKQFAGKPWDEPASEITPRGQGKKTWKFVAQNVHDFAWTADPTYRIGEAEWKGVKCIALAQECHAAGWQDAAEFTAKVIEVYSQDIGPYAYPKMIVADAEDGMEYPMLTLDGGRSPSYYGLLAHEVGHNWFFGMVGSNETYRAALDEGFTQFLTAHCLRRLVGPTIARGGELTDTYYGSCYYSYIRDARSGYEGTLNTHSNEFNGALGHENGYRSVYHKTAVMLYNLEYVLGHDVFWSAMHHYFEKWKFAHPYPEDFREAITEYAHTDLTWFFDQWMETHAVIDYAVTGIKNENGKAMVTFRRKGGMQMPIDFVAVTAGGDSLRFTIPNTEYQKQTAGVTILPRWLGYDKINPEYTVVISSSSKVKEVIIDPTHKLADINLLDNQTGCMPTEWKVSLMPDKEKGYPSWQKYNINLSPSVWYNGYSGVSAGVLFKGNYLQSSAKTSLGVWFNTGLGVQSSGDDIVDPQGDFHKLSYVYTYETPLRKFGPDFVLNVRSAFRDGVQDHSMGFSRKWAKGRSDYPDYHRFYGGYRYLERAHDGWRNYLLYPDRWTAGQSNAFLEMGYEKGYGILNGSGLMNIELRASGPGSDANYGRVRFTSIYKVDLHKLHFRYRLFAQYGDGAVPMESALYLAEGNPEEMLKNPFFRAKGFFPGSMLNNDLGRTTYHTQMGGGLNLRGYAGYAAEYADLSPAWYGTSGAALNLELEFNKLIGWRPASFSNFLQSHLYAFYDAGVIARSTVQRGFDRPGFDVLRMDAGLGLAVDISEKHYLQGGPLTIRADFPLWVNRAPAREEFFQFRWMLGIGRTF